MGGNFYQTVELRTDQNVVTKISYRTSINAAKFFSYDMIGIYQVAFSTFFMKYSWNFRSAANLRDV